MTARSVQRDACGNQPVQGVGQRLLVGWRMAT
jgi:hypothetical protein